jgi:hypothetical protein
MKIPKSIQNLLIIYFKCTIIYVNDFIMQFFYTVFLLFNLDVTKINNKFNVNNDNIV